MTNTYGVRPDHRPYIARSERPRSKTRRRQTDLPYGLWICDDGRQILFNRYYEPLWQRVGNITWPADREEWVKFREQSWFYADSHTRKHTALCRRLEVILTLFQEGEDVRQFAKAVWAREEVQ